MKYLLMTAALLLPNVALAQEHAHHVMQASEDGTKPKPADYHSPAMPPESGKAIRKYAIDEPGAEQTNFGVMSMHDNAPFFQFRADRLEYRNSDDSEVLLWEADSWYGNDENKLYLESEGEWNTLEEQIEAAQLEVFWNHTISTFWDTQLGIRHDFKPEDMLMPFAGDGFKVVFIICLEFKLPQLFAFHRVFVVA